MFQLRYYTSFTESERKETQGREERRREDNKKKKKINQDENRRNLIVFYEKMSLFLVCVCDVF